MVLQEVIYCLSCINASEKEWQPCEIYALVYLFIYLFFCIINALHTSVHLTVFFFMPLGALCLALVRLCTRALNNSEGLRSALNVLMEQGTMAEY